MRIHHEGYRILLVAGLICGSIGWCITALSYRIRWLVWLGTGGLYALLVLFFRVPLQRNVSFPDSILAAPASGTIVAIETMHESELLHTDAIKISIFLSVFNVHVNVVPVSGTVTARQYHPGLYLVAFHPKASLLNERSSTHITTSGGQPILIRQIAGILARRISTYTSVGQTVKRGEELGFIRFGSRLDVFVPLDSQVLVKVGDRL